MRKLALSLCAMMIMGLGFLPGRECEAQDTFAGGAKNNPTTPCCAPQSPETSCPYEQSCVSVACLPEASRGNALTRFFAFGCRLNYRLTTWILSDKCEVGGMMAPY
jgi:hypothetical protein